MPHQFFSRAYYADNPTFKIGSMEEASEEKLFFSLFVYTLILLAYQ